MASIRLRTGVALACLAPLIGCGPKTPAPPEAAVLARAEGVFSKIQGELASGGFQKAATFVRSMDRKEMPVMLVEVESEGEASGFRGGVLTKTGWRSRPYGYPDYIAKPTPIKEKGLTWQKCGYTSHAMDSTAPLRPAHRFVKAITHKGVSYRATILVDVPDPQGGE